jgi:nuclear pore complex protein Nup88
LLQGLCCAVAVLIARYLILQTLLLTDPPYFEVERLSVNGIASQLAIVGLRGVAVLDLPRRWGKEATFQGGKLTITCR